MEKQLEILRKRKELITNLDINYGIKAINVYLDAYNEYKRMLREYFVKFGILDQVDEMEMTYTFLSLFYKGHLMSQPYYDNPRIAECVLYSFYVELFKIGQHLALKSEILNILATNGSKESEVYRLIVNDKITRNQQEKLEENVKRIRRKQVSVFI